MTDKDNCTKPTRECPIDSVFMQEHGAMMTQIAEIYKTNKASTVVRWVAILVSVAVVSFGVGREISLEGKATAVLERSVVATALVKLNDKLDLSMKEITLKIDINSNRLTAIEARVKP